MICDLFYSRHLFNFEGQIKKIKKNWKALQITDINLNNLNKGITQLRKDITANIGWNEVVSICIAFCYLFQR